MDRFAGTIPEKLERQRALRILESERDEAWRVHQASRDIERQKDALFDEIARRLEQASICRFSLYDGA